MQAKVNRRPPGRLSHRDNLARCGIFAFAGSAASLPREKRTKKAPADKGKRRGLGADHSRYASHTGGK